jgi:hypothetical protein
MSDRDEDCESCQAFNELFNSINVLLKSKKNGANSNALALEKCKKEIEMLLCATGADDGKSV